jgi:hypothetical protein
VQDRLLKHSQQVVKKKPLEFKNNLPEFLVGESEGHSARKPPRPAKKRKRAYESTEADQALFEPRRNPKGGNEFS